jgi:nicotinate-nucleotide adenylyltransferase
MMPTEHSPLIDKNALVLFGGTFNPPHYGHIEPLRWIMDKLNIARVGLMPCNIPPHKATLNVNNKHRLAMLNLVCEEEPRFYIEPIELNRATVSYTVDTLRELCFIEKRTIYLVMGTDSFNTIESWHEWRSLFSLCNFIVLKRSEQPLIKLQEVTGYIELTSSDDDGDLHLNTTHLGYVISTQCPITEVSSTYLREQLAKIEIGKSQNQLKLLPQRVVNYVKEHSLYK